MVELYRRKPITVEAEQFVIWDLNKIPNYVELHNVRFPVYKDVHKRPYIVIPTAEGNLTVKNLTYIIKGEGNELYPCDQDIFMKTYEKV